MSEKSVLKVVTSLDGLSKAYASVPRPSVPTARAQRAVVMTMGALHEGHAALIRAARDEVGLSGHVTVTIFVNPTQFGAGEDFDRYPRTLEADIQLCADEDVDLVFAPAMDAIYPDGDPQVTVSPGVLGDVLEGEIRPGHFGGVLTVVMKLLNLTGADVALFGEKDYQQVILIQQMVKDLNLRTRIQPVPTVRAKDGLALSSRNRYLNDSERHAALAIPEAIRQARVAAELGRGPDAIVGTAELQLISAGLEVDYVKLLSPTMGPTPAQGPARLLIAARAGATRLLDNAEIIIRG